MWVGKPKPPGYDDFDMPFNQFYHTHKIITPDYQSGGSPNNDTLYSMTWLDLSKEPVILSHPDMGDRYFTFELASMTSDNFGYIGKRTTGGKAGNYLIAGPGWKGEQPEGVQMPAASNGTKLMKLSPTSPTNNVLVFGRTEVLGENDVKAVTALQDEYRLTPLSLWGKRDAKLPASRDTWKPNDRKKDPLADWKTINRSMAENPPLAQNALMLEQFETIGIGPGLDVEAFDDAIKKELARAAKDGRALLYAASSLCHHERGTMPAEVPVKQFWSLIVYDLETLAFINSPLMRPGLSTFDLPNMKKNPDGSVTMYFGPKAPEGLESNWVPTSGKKPFPVVRMSGGTDKFWDKSWTMPDVELAEKVIMP